MTLSMHLRIVGILLVLLGLSHAFFNRYFAWERESLYRALSAKGNPRLSTLVAVTKAVGLRLTVEVAE